MHADLSGIFTDLAYGNHDLMWVVLLIPLIYGGYMLYLLYGWLKLPQSDLVTKEISDQNINRDNHADQLKFSLIIPARNESDQIRQCLNSLLNQQCMDHLNNSDQHSKKIVRRSAYAH
jgi:cellulose synthase/poly-beta-1,6-N-acetylglucosamine synthase-like glycosyltransferase